MSSDIKRESVNLFYYLIDIKREVKYLVRKNMFILCSNYTAFYKYLFQLVCFNFLSLNRLKNSLILSINHNIPLFTFSTYQKFIESKICCHYYRAQIIISTAGASNFLFITILSFRNSRNTSLIFKKYFNFF